MYSNQDFYYTTRSLLKMFSGQSRPLPIYAYTDIITCLEIRNNLVFTGHSNGVLNVLDLRSNKILFNKKIHKTHIFDIKLNLNQIYTCSKDFQICYNEFKELEDEKSDIFLSSNFHTLFPSHEDIVSSIIFYDGACVSMSRDCSLKSWEHGNLKCSYANAHDNWIKCGAAMDNFFVTGCRNGVIKCWDINNNSICNIGKLDIGSGINCMLKDKNSLWIGCQNNKIHRVNFNMI